MDAFDAFQMFQAMKLHFQPGSYDYKKYHGRTNYKRDSFETRKDKYNFQKLSKRDNLELFLAENIRRNPKMWVGELFSDECEQRFKDALKRIQSLSYLFKEDIAKFETLDEALVVHGGDYPKILKMNRAGEIHDETLIILDRVLGVFTYWSNNIDDKVLWPNTKRNLTNYGSFLEIDKDKYNKIMLDFFT